MNELPLQRPAENSVGFLPAVVPRAGVSMSVFAGLAVVATGFAQGLAPALPGSTTGIAQLIQATSFIAACTSQLVAAGGIALSLRLLSGLLPWPNLGVAFRMVIVPTTLAVVALTIASAAQPIDPELGRIVAVSAIVALLSALPLLWSSSRTRAMGLVLLLAGFGAILDLAAYELARRAAAAPTTGALGSTLAAGGLLFDATAAGLAFVWVAQTARRSAIGAASLLLVVAVAVVIARAGTLQHAGAALVVLHRSLEGLSARPSLVLPSSASHSLTLILFGSAATLLFIPGRRPELRAALTLCLLGRTATGAPAAALLTIGAVLTAMGRFLESDAKVRRVLSDGAPLRSP